MIYKDSVIANKKSAGENVEDDQLWKDERDLDELAEGTNGFNPSDFEEAEDYPMDFEE